MSGRVGSGRVGGRAACVVGIDLLAGDFEIPFGIADRDSSEHEDLVGMEDTEEEAYKDNELIAVEGFELPTKHIPGCLLARLMKTHLFFLPHEEGGGEGFHGHDGVDLHPNALAAFLGGVLQTPVLFGVAEQIVFNEAALIVAIKGDEGVLDAPVGDQHDLLVDWGGLVIPGFDHNGIERVRLVVFLGRIGVGALGIEPVAGQKPRYPDQFGADPFRVSFFSITVCHFHITAGGVRALGFECKLAGVDSGFHVFLERDDELDALLMDIIKYLAVEEASIDHQGTNHTGRPYVLLGLLQYGKDVEIVRLFDGIDLNGQGNAGVELIDSPDLPAVNGDLHRFELASFSLAFCHDFALAAYGSTALELLGGLIVRGVAGDVKVLGEYPGGGQSLDTTIEEVFDGSRCNLNDLVGQRVGANGSPNLRCGSFPYGHSPCATSVSDLISVEAAYPHEQLIGEQEIMDRFHLGNRTDGLHQKHENKLDERNVLPLPIFGSDAFQERKNLDFPQILEEEIKEGGFIQCENGVHFPAAEKVVGDSRIIPFRRVPEKTFEYRLLEFFSRGHVQHRLRGNGQSVQTQIHPILEKNLKNVQRIFIP